MRTMILTGLLALLTATPAAARTPGPVPFGTWLNPHGSVAVKTGLCGSGICGWIVWASQEALADANDAGVTPLIGTELLENYRASSRGTWSGTVFVPDMGRRFSSEIDQIAPDRLKVKGCLLGGLICKSQIWTRITRAPQ